MAGSNGNEGAKKLQKSYFDVLGLCCSSEVPLIEKILKPLEGVKNVSVIVPSKTVIVIHDNLLISQAQIVKALNQAGLEANVRVYGDNKGNYKKKWPSPYAVACGILLVLSFLKYVCRPFQWLALAAVAIGICPILMKAVAAIRNFTLDVNLLMIIAVVGSIVLKDYWEAGLIVFLFTTAEWLESRAGHKATAIMSSLMNIVPRRAILAETGEEVDVDAVNVDTILAVKAGEIIPIDGIVVEGECEVDEKTLTGESFPVSKQKESTVLAGTINLNGYISVRTTALAEDCAVARMTKLVEEAQNQKSKTQKFIDQCTKYYTPGFQALRVSLVIQWQPALIEYGQSHSVDPKIDKVEEFQNFPGEGIYGKIDGKDIYVGNKKIAMRAGCETVPTLEGDTREGKSIGYIFFGAKPAGIFCLSDACRTGVKEAIEELKSMGIRTAMLTGDSNTAAMHAQHLLGDALDVVHAELLPEDKARIIKDFQKEAPTAMIGDGLNDAPALATADIGISMGISGSALATETGHVILMSNDIRKIPKVARLARKTRRKVIENVILSITTKAAILALAFAGHPLVWAAVLADVGTCLLVIFNSMLLLQGTHKHGTKSHKSSYAQIHQDCRKTDIDNSSHNQKLCCSHTEAQTIREPQKCGSSKTCTPKCQSLPSSSSTCGNNKCSDSSDKQGCGASEDQSLQEEKHSGHERFDMVTENKGLCCGENHGCSGQIVSSPCEEGNSSNSVDNEIHEATHCDHGNHDRMAHDMASQGLHDHSDVCSSELSHHLKSNDHCHSLHCVDSHVNKDIINEELDNMVETSCKHYLPKQEIHSECKKHDTGYGASLHVTNHWECAPMKACMSLKKRRIVGCCTSYRKECCQYEWTIWR
ncbi:hypothetical protein F0562_030746 [Nyssa sinensis]|uniref:HMA domain-containing protein n=1 Tax=Nyssa sinensis TaxID=561372 RepID=A0A5J5B1J4_9ASTE|nr:hypothetical protein F0562_030746 [Nyssa sinensis]